MVLEGDGDHLVEYLKGAKGIVLEKGTRTSPAAIVGIALDIPVIYSTKNATDHIKDGEMVTVDSNRGIVYSGMDKTGSNWKKQTEGLGKN